jgi:serine/threonine protein kinase
MALAPGSKLGPFEVVALLGAGGMGEVYRARDTRLGRDVALKILVADSSADAGRVSRFEQEARAAAALNHPNILGVHDLGTENGVFYLASELVSGEPLSAIIQRGPVPLRKLLDIAVQITDGMAAAHAAGVVHRDLKPANVMIAADGRAKILDFGLAKQLSRPFAASGEAPTVHQTEPGTILGTVSYMSPEQACGKVTDHRSDQFSFGLVLYEMASGKRAFDKPESVQILSAIVTEEPPLLDQRIPAPLRWSIDRCLAKDPADRYESTRDLHRELRGLRDHLSETSSALSDAATVPGGALRPRRIRWSVPAAFGLGAGVALSLTVFFARSPIPDQSSYRFTPFSFETGGQSRAVWSPDGKAVAYAAALTPNAPRQVFIRYLDSPAPLQLTHLSKSVRPLAWTPDSTRILFLQDEPEEIRSIANVGGEPELWMPLSHLRGDVAISPDSTTVAAFRSENGVSSVWLGRPGRGFTRYTPAPFASRTIPNFPRVKFAPDGKQILMTMNGGRGGEEVWLLPYPAGVSLPKRILADLQTYSGTPTIARLPDSRHVILSLQPAPDASLHLWVADTITGEHHALTSGNAPRDLPAVSPDGQALVFSETTGHFDVVSVDLEHARVRTLIATERNEMMSAWAAKQAALVYVTDRNGASEIWLHRPDSPERPVVTARQFPGLMTQWFVGPAISPDGARIIYARIGANGTNARLWISATTGGAPVQLTNDTTTLELPGSWSPDGNWFVYLGERNGKTHLLKIKTSGQATPEVLKSDVISDVPSWSPDGKWIAYGHDLISPDGRSTKPLGDHGSPHYAFSANSALVYGLREERDREVLFSVAIATGQEKVIGDVGKFRYGSPLGPAYRFSLAPDGKSLVYGTGQFQENLVMLEGFAPRGGLFARLGSR